MSINIDVIKRDSSQNKCGESFVYLCPQVVPQKSVAGEEGPNFSHRNTGAKRTETECPLGKIIKTQQTPCLCGKFSIPVLKRMTIAP